MRFDVAVPPGGYTWWYIDALSDDGRHGLTLIAFVGSVFSPYYAWSRRRGPAEPTNHCALNVALYGSRASRWSMTERGADALRRERCELQIGSSHLRLAGDAIDISVDEVCVPIPRRLRGAIRLTPTALGGESFALDTAGCHRWTPFAPCAHVDVRLTHPELSWSGLAYLDSNFGTEPLENGFREWTWSRASVPGGTVVLYDVQERAAFRDTAPAARSLALRFAGDAVATAIDPPPIVQLPRTGWRLARRTRADAGHGAQLVSTLEDAPFYSRSLLRTRLLGSAAPAVHESLDLNRFDARWVQCLLPFRMPRRFF